MWESRKTRSQLLGSLCAKPGGNGQGRRALAALPGYDTHGFSPPLAKMTSSKEILAQGFLTEPFTIIRACALDKSLCREPPASSPIRCEGDQSARGAGEAKDGEWS